MQQVQGKLGIQRWLRHSHFLSETHPTVWRQAWEQRVLVPRDGCCGCHTCTGKVSLRLLERHLPWSLSGEPGQVGTPGSVRAQNSP